jgi:hypothetical protein
MNPLTPIKTVIFLTLALAACTSEGLKRGAYESLHQKQCMDRTGEPNCDPEHSSYENYQGDREQLLESTEKPDRPR